VLRVGFGQTHFIHAVRKFTMVASIVSQLCQKLYQLPAVGILLAFTGDGTVCGAVQHVLHGHDASRWGRCS
jgi:hypothetical protein